MSVNGSSTGTISSLEGIYSFNSGTSGYFYNQLYSTGSHIQSGILYAPVIPLINVYNPIISNSTFSGNNGVRAGYIHSGNFSLILDITYSGCLRDSASSGLGYVLFSSVDSPSQLTSGFLITINDSNRLSFHTNNKKYTLNQELDQRDFVMISLTENQFVSFGIYKLGTNIFYNKNVALDNPLLNTNSLYFGNLLTNDQPNFYTGFKGKINQLLLFNDGLSEDDVKICSTCSLVTGMIQNNNIVNISGLKLTGYYFSGIQNTVISGSVLVSGSISKNDSSTINILYPSGISAVISSGEIVQPLFQQVQIQTSGNSYSFLYDTSARDQFCVNTIEFDSVLNSGDIVEIYSYGWPNEKIGKRISNFIWPETLETVQLVNNGLNETKDIDYTVLHNLIQGLDENDILSYDLVSGNSIVTSYSGYWNNSKIQMSGGGYFPPTSQYLENTGLFSGQVKITGLNFVSINNPFYPRFGYDLFMNGQKLISGQQYDIVNSGTSGFIVSLSGNILPLLNINAIYNTGYALPTGIDSTDDNELTFLPQFSGFTSSLIIVTGNLKSLNSITGCSEQIWINGLRQTLNIDYFKYHPCDSIPSVLTFEKTPFNIYNSLNDNGYWNITLPPFIFATWNDGWGIDGPDTANITPLIDPIDEINFPTEDVDCCEIQYCSSYDGVSTEWRFYGIVRVNSLNTLNYFGPEGPLQKGLRCRFRYHYQNIIGHWNDTFDWIFNS